MASQTEEVTQKAAEMDIGGKQGKKGGKKGEGSALNEVSVFWSSEEGSEGVGRRGTKGCVIGGWWKWGGEQRERGR